MDDVLQRRCGLGSAEAAIFGRLAFQPCRFLLLRRDVAQIAPRGVLRCGRCRGLGHPFDRADERHEVYLAYDLQLAFRSPPDGHLIECGAQATGGNHQANWQQMEGLDRVGYPIVEVTQAGEIEVKLPGRYAVTGALAGALKSVAGVVQVEHV